MSVVLDLIANVTHRPGGVAVIDGEVTLTWSELFSLVRQVGAWLAAEGFARGDRLVYAGARITGWWCGSGLPCDKEWSSYPCTTSSPQNRSPTP